MPTIKSTDETFDNILKENKIVLTDFWATWCSPCISLAPILEQLSDELKDKGVVIAKHNIDEEPNLPVKFSVRGIPACFMVKTSEVVGSKIGLTNRQDFLDWVKSNI